MSPRTNFVSDWQQLNPDEKISVVGFYDSKDATKFAVEKLKEQGFESDAISLVIPDKMNVEDLELEKYNKGPEGTIVGATTGAVIGGAVGWLIGIGAFSATGTVQVLVSGAVISAITGLIVGGIFGGLSGGFIGLAIPEIGVKKHLSNIGGIQLFVRCTNSDWINQAKKLLEITGAHDIASLSEA